LLRTRTSPRASNALLFVRAIGSADAGRAPLFHSSAEESDTFATRLHDHGYLTALMGKYLNGYTPQRGVGGKGLYIPPGWSE
jgi:hypothetical protein